VIRLVLVVSAASVWLFAPVTDDLGGLLPAFVGRFDH
jgi:hypothetical protein